MSPKVFIKTLGCAMNERDSEHLFAELREKEGYERTDRAEEADLILINTCSVRERPVAKLFSELGAFNLIRKERAKIGVCGCTASALGEKIFARAPYVDFVLGARNVSKITEAIKNSRSVFTGTGYDESEFAFAEGRFNKYRALINISIGCDKQCAYCIVPATRGKEISIPSKLILNEAKKAVESGAVEVVLLGQNVNSYGSRFSSPHKKIDFPELLEEISQIDGLKRIRFQSPHPLHIDDRFLRVFADNPKICKHIHIPLQSGSTKILRAMRRGYTKEWYLDRALKVREMVKDATISTDIIVGFPGEREEDFEESLDVMRQVKFEQLFSFKFSPRELTAAALMGDRVEDKTASKRLWRIHSLYKKQLNEAMDAQIGKEFDVFLELADDRKTLYGKSHNFYSFRIFNGAKEGEFVKVRAVGIKNGALIGEAVEQTR
ncbi:MAG: tRNA (N6-isopentenyl adenosine(37)-C2)-methylthiotransferase MiaB [Helicobacteraceae bacterium]|nr:tRNA (N6-isopentenyl adenosine(37)-C2)-methylthiotransferase MiaB [Helicobacteraceae bacterium]